MRHFRRNKQVLTGAGHPPMSAREAAARAQMSRFIMSIMPFADAASTDLPLARLFRLSLFQVSVGITLVLLGGTLNRVMAIELGIPVSIIAVAMALPLVAAPARAPEDHALLKTVDHRLNERSIHRRDRPVHDADDIGGRFVADLLQHDAGGCLFHALHHPPFRHWREKIMGAKG